MSHFAKVRNNQVEEVIVAEQDVVAGFTAEPGVRWIQTSYNTHAGQHTLGGRPLRKNYAGVGYIYSDELDAFIPPKMFDSWILNTDTGRWQAPVPYPTDGLVYEWNEYIPGWEQRAYYS
jgi:hypothetical protein